ncbi:hypothetical protein BHE74_00030069 [Ensete ventricosum]|nr:hypothetical protein BHE74_00030069 [Ensete ventricosum]
MHPTLAKHAYECSSEELMNRASKLVVWISTLSSIPFVFFLSFCLSFLFPSLRRGFILLLLSLTRYRVALEWLRGKHPEIEVEQDSFVECPEDANVNMDLSQPFDDSSPSEK